LQQNNQTSFGRQARLLNAKDFQYVFDGSKRSSTGMLLVLYRPNDFGFSRLGLIVSKKCEKRAVGRNRLKRLIRESFRKNQEFIANLDVIVIARKGLAKEDNNKVFIDLEKHWQRLIKCKS